MSENNKLATEQNENNVEEKPKKKSIGTKAMDVLKGIGSLAAICMCIMLFVAYNKLDDKETASTNYDDAIEIIGQYTEENEETNPVTIKKLVYNRNVQDAEGNTVNILNPVYVNNTAEEVKNVSIGFVAWDSDKNPIIIKWTDDSDPDGDYFYPITYSKTVYGKETYGRDEGFIISDETSKKISYARAIILSYEKVDGTLWQNPKAEWFVEKYANKSLSQDDINNLCANTVMIAQ